jgi:hypothetical protein
LSGVAIKHVDIDESRVRAIARRTEDEPQAAEEPVEAARLLFGEKTGIGNTMFRGVDCEEQTERYRREVTWITTVNFRV